jgi:cobalt-zinc-cadmium resistance protein CzcA
LATVVIGGLITATFLTLFVLPLLYVMFSSRRKMNTSVITVLLFGLASLNTANTQTVNIKTITIEDAVSTALKSNLEIQSMQLNVLSNSTLKKSIFELPKTNVNLQFGQYNSNNQDKAFQIFQSIPFPTYFTAKSALYKAELLRSELQEQATANEIKAQVKHWFNELQYLQKVKIQLQTMDSLYEDILNAVNLRHKTGETNLLEKTTVDTKRGTTIHVHKTKRNRNCRCVQFFENTYEYKRGFCIERK